MPSFVTAYTGNLLHCACEYFVSHLVFKAVHSGIFERPLCIHVTFLCCEDTVVATREFEVTGLFTVCKDASQVFIQDWINAVFQLTLHRY